MTKRGRGSELWTRRNQLRKRQRDDFGRVKKLYQGDEKEDEKENGDKENTPPLSSNKQLENEKMNSKENSQFSQLENGNKENGDKENSPPLSFNRQNLSLELENYYLALKDLNLIRSKAIIKHLLEKGINFIDSLSFDLVRQYCPTHYAIWTQILCSKKPHKLKDLTKKRKIDLHICFQVESALIIEKEKTISTPLILKLSLLAYFGGLSQAIHRDFNDLGILKSHKTVTRLIPTLREGLINRSRMLLKTPPSSQLIRLIIADNLNPHSIKKTEMSTAPFCSTIKSVSVLFKFVPWKVLEGSQTSTVSPAQAFNSFEFMLAIDEGITLPPSMCDIIDHGVLDQSLKHFTAYPCLPYQSSSYQENLDNLGFGLLKKECNIESCESVFVGDPEFLLHTHKMIYLHYETFRRLVIFPSIWHLTKHLIESLFADKIFFILFTSHYYTRFYQNQIEKREGLFDILINAIREAVEQYEREHGIISSTNYDSIMSCKQLKTSKATGYPFGKYRYLIDKAVEEEEKVETNEDVGDTDTSEVENSEEIEEEIDNSFINSNSLPFICSKEKMSTFFQLTTKYLIYGLDVGRLTTEHLQKFKLNYTRQKQIAFVLALAFLQCQEKLEKLVKTPLTALLYSYLNEGLVKTIFLPYADIVIHGDATSFIHRFHSMISLLGHYHRLNIVKAYGPLLASFYRWKNDREDILYNFLSHCSSSNEVKIEYYNSFVMRYTDDTQMRTFKQIQLAGLLFNFFHPDENNTEESTKEVESKHPYFRRCKLGIGEARLVETKLGSKKMEEEISYSCNYLKRLFKALNKTGPNFNNLELFQNRFHSILENGRQNAIDCMTKYEKSLAKLKNKDGKDKFSNLLSSLTLPYLRVALKLEGKSDSGKKEDLINRIKACYTGGILQFGRALQDLGVTDENVNDIYESFH